ELSVEQHDGDAVVTVRDNGMGIVAAALPHLFDPRKRIDEPHDDAGLGIGLSLVKKLVELHGGTIEAHSTGAGQGATFVVRLPCTTAAPARGADASGSDPQTPRRRILIVDDNDDAAASLAKLLEHAGHEVRDVRDGRSALDIVREFAPDVVLLDIGLPDMDGWELSRAALGRKDRSDQADRDQRIRAGRGSAPLARRGDRSAPHEAGRLRIDRRVAVAPSSSSSSRSPNWSSASRA